MKVSKICSTWYTEACLLCSAFRLCVVRKLSSSESVVPVVAIAKQAIYLLKNIFLIWTHLCVIPPKRWKELLWSSEFFFYGMFSFRWTHETLIWNIFRTHSHKFFIRLFQGWTFPPWSSFLCSLEKSMQAFKTFFMQKLRPSDLLNTFDMIVK